MTDLEISKALALAIGWHPGLIIKTPNEVRCYRGVKQWGWQKFDYRDWNVIGPIAERFDCFPTKSVQPSRKGEWWSREGMQNVYADIAQKAIALAVIGGVK